MCRLQCVPLAAGISPFSENVIIVVIKFHVPVHSGTLFEVCNALSSIKSILSSTSFGEQKFPTEGTDVDGMRLGDGSGGGVVRWYASALSIRLDTG